VSNDNYEGLFPAPSASRAGAVGQESPLGENEVGVVPAQQGGCGQSPVDGQEMICKGCKHFWGLDLLAAVRNLKEDGTPYKTQEAWCKVTGWGLVSLSERFVLTCTEFEEKT
jgi:hypothetical protein